MAGLTSLGGGLYGEQSWAVNTREEEAALVIFCQFPRTDQGKAFSFP